MRIELDTSNWVRRQHFDFFRSFDEPYYSICVRIDCTQAYGYVKRTGSSFFLYYLYCSIKAANEVEPFRYRTEGDRVYIYDKIHVSTTIDRPDGTFGFSYIPYHEDFAAFEQEGKIEIERVRTTTELFTEIPTGANTDVIHYSTVPWIDFTSLTHVRHFSEEDSCPKITFGKMTEREGKYSMPVMIHVNHALIDGRHLGEYVDALQRYMDKNS